MAPHACESGEARCGAERGKHPWVVLKYHHGVFDGFTEHRTHAEAKAYQDRWSRLSNTTWPRACQCSAENTYEYKAPMLRCEAQPDPGPNKTSVTGTSGLLREWERVITRAADRFAFTAATTKDPDAVLEVGAAILGLEQRLNTIQGKMETLLSAPPAEFRRALAQHVADLDEEGRSYERARKKLPAAEAAKMPRAPHAYLLPQFGKDEIKKRREAKLEGEWTDEKGRAWRFERQQGHVGLRPPKLETKLRDPRNAKRAAYGVLPIQREHTRLVATARWVAIRSNGAACKNVFETPASLRLRQSGNELVGDVGLPIWSIVYNADTSRLDCKQVGSKPETFRLTRRAHVVAKAVAKD